MRTYDLTPFYRSTVGFDRFFSLLDQATADGSPGYPPYNIERTGENAYRISVAVSGFSQGELSIVAKENTLTIKGEKTANENGQDQAEVLYRGIAARAFERAFQLADFVQVKNASLDVVGRIAGAAVGGCLVEQRKEAVEADGGTIKRGKIVGTHRVVLH